MIPKIGQIVRDERKIFVRFDVQPPNSVRLVAALHGLSGLKILSVRFEDISHVLSGILTAISIFQIVVQPLVIFLGVHAAMCALRHRSSILRAIYIDAVLFEDLPCRLSVFRLPRNDMARLLSTPLPASAIFLASFEPR